MNLVAMFVPFVHFGYPESAGLSHDEVGSVFLPADMQNDGARNVSILNGAVDDLERGKARVITQEVEKTVRIGSQSKGRT
ncbi:hypothetical protein EJ03DRAFT_326008 [Teratosphaeria nubilosa]|uniref:Uncharacterized protein n=1 Tax=Teratosphaeria nubilosa TaxID=161662 RepID=A0A6G1LES8_9PEZI|nr:hypothetical protein EJ03DRAFT_326008 [Teratosphaeria nubilosa]